MVDFEQNPEALAWAEKRLGVVFGAEPARWLTSRSTDGTILGVVIFSRFTTGNCEVTVVGEPGFITKSFAYAVAWYVFGQLDQRRATAIIAVDKSKSLNLAQRLGFRIEGTLKEWYSTGDAYILGILRKDCSFYKDITDGQPQRTQRTRSMEHSRSSGLVQQHGSVVQHGAESAEPGYSLG